MSETHPTKRTPIQRAALRLVAREMREYDTLSRRARLVVDRSNIHAIDEVVDLTHGTRSCAHGRALHEPCGECERSEQDCKAYRVAAQQRIKDLLSQLGE
jgi:hypothetical protein